MSIKDQAPSALFNRLVKSILTLQKTHDYRLCKDFEEGVRIIADALLDRELMKFEATQRAQRKPLNISIKKRWYDRFYPYRNWLLLFWSLSFIASVFCLGVISAPYFSEPTAVPVITVEEFNEMAEKCPN